jgi:hypothetical protein
MRWVEALKKYNEGKKWSIPKKGSAEYDAVKKIMGAGGEATGTAAAEKTVVAKTPKGKKVVKVEEAAMAKAPAVPPKARKPRAKKVPSEEKPHPKVRKPRAKKTDPVAVDPGSNAVDADRKMKRRAPAKAGSAPSATLPQGVTARAVERSGNPSAILESMANAHLPVVPKETIPGLLLGGQEGDALLRPRHLPVLIEKEKVVDEVPFSFQKLRFTLGA